MGKVCLVAVVSVDGYVADNDDGVGPLFDWYGNGDVAATFSDPDRVFHVSPEVLTQVVGKSRSSPAV